MFSPANSPSLHNLPCEPVLTVRSFLKQLRCEDLLEADVDVVESVCRVHDLRVLGIDEQKQARQGRCCEFFFFD